jgi:hypothetical protein
MSREYLVSPDGKAVAVRTDEPDPQEWNAWGVIHCKNGGHWSSSSELDGWTTIAAPDTTPEPEPNYFEPEPNYFEPEPTGDGGDGDGAPE